MSASQLQQPRMATGLDAIALVVEMVVLGMGIATVCYSVWHFVVWPLLWAAAPWVLWLALWGIKGTALHLLGFILANKPVKALAPTTDQLEKVLLFLVIVTASLAVRVFAVQPSILHEFILTGMLARIIAEKHERERKLCECCRGDVEAPSEPVHTRGAPDRSVATKGDEANDCGNRPAPPARRRGGSVSSVSAPGQAPIVIEVTCVSPPVLDV
eukprot:TRINITY_DN61796_c0_g1_i1.p2 TRINITY_DN61796_c0_g1~~TRINITY_DN61796_c0_g1_i1.p2  ORF type:complete len:248 (+),score=52.84 TRINITY_DN61796_c0_g1_i1:103-744(+)